jgi:hypothetical protein
MTFDEWFENEHCCDAYKFALGWAWNAGMEAAGCDAAVADALTRRKEYDDALVAAERERCAQACEALDNDQNSSEYRAAARWAAARIRAA